MSHTPALDLSKYDLLEAKDKLFAYVCVKAESWGMDPRIECFLLSPGQSGVWTLLARNVGGRPVQLGDFALRGQRNLRR